MFLRRPALLALFLLALAAAGSAGAQTPCTLTCPANITAATAPGAQTAIVNYPTPVASGSNCSGQPFQVAGLPSGQPFPVGVTTNVWQVAVVGGGAPVSCQFTVTVTATPALPATPVPMVGPGGVAALVVLLLGLGLLASRARS